MPGDDDDDDDDPAGIWDETRKNKWCHGCDLMYALSPVTRSDGTSAGGDSGKNIFIWIGVSVSCSSRGSYLRICWATSHC